MKTVADALAHVVSKGIKAHERDEIIRMLRTLPIAEVRAKSRRSYLTLARIAEVAL